MTISFQNFEHVRLEEAQLPRPTAAPAIFKRVFATAGRFKASEVSPAAADAACLKDLLRPSDLVTAKALVVDGLERRACVTPNCASGESENIDWALSPRTTYQRLDGTLVGTTNDAGLLMLPVNAPVGTDAIHYWTGLQDDWTSGSSCDGWSSSDWTKFGHSGAALATDSGLIFQIQQYCNVEQGLLCVEQ